MESKQLIETAESEIIGAYGSKSNEDRQVNALRSIAYSNIAMAKMVSNIIGKGCNDSNECECNKHNTECTPKEYNDYIAELVDNIEVKIKERFNYESLNETEKQSLYSDIYDIVYYGMLPE
jgi:hypothetical protein